MNNKRLRLCFYTSPVGGMNEILGVGLKMGLFLHVVAVSPSDATLDEVRFGLKSARIC